MVNSVRRLFPQDGYYAAGFLGLLLAASAVASGAADSAVSGTVTDPRGKIVALAKVRLIHLSDSTVQEGSTDAQGRYAFESLEPGDYLLSVDLSGFASVNREIVLIPGQTNTVDLQFSRIAEQNESVTVVADVSQANIFSPDPAQRVFIRQETLDANPGRPGMPISIPGAPVESPAGGIKPPQYFVPGVAGDHGEPIAQFFQIGRYLFPNNLPANAHGNGYADPNILIPIAIESVQTDGGAFNVLEGNNSVHAAMIFGLRDRLDPLVRLTADYRDMNLVAGWSPADPGIKEWIGVEASFGNGFLDRLEHRKQFKANISRSLSLEKHDLALYGIGYSGFSYLPGLSPIKARVPGDTYDWRQKEEASSGIVIATDLWHLTSTRELQFSGYFRTYSLDVRPNFGDGLIRQSEFRTATAQSVDYLERLRPDLSLLAGFEFRREAPRKLNLDRFDETAGIFRPATSNDLTLHFYSPYASLDGALTPYLHYNVGLRRDEVSFNNRDRLQPAQSFDIHQGVSSPKGTISLLPPESLWVPSVALSYGHAFHVNDPRIGTTALRETTAVSKARSYQLVLKKSIAKTDFKATLAHVTTAQQLARIDNDTGLQQDQGPGLVRSMTLSARRYFAYGSLQASFARADARDRINGEPTPEAPRLIWDVLATIDRLPFRLKARGEYEYAGRKPLGNGFNAVPVKEFRGAVLRSFENNGMDIGINFLLTQGYAGQTLETLALPGESGPFERIAGFPLKSYVTVSWTYRFGRAGRP
ncbi:MAG: TonB-dependent receptor [Acidobacteria bacterium]|nr:TonB-dependent receptor [Acidobacteriota bacterium]